MHNGIGTDGAVAAPTITNLAPAFRARHIAQLHALKKQCLLLCCVVVSSTLAAADFQILSSDGQWHSGATTVSTQTLSIAGKQIPLQHIIVAQQAELPAAPVIDRGVMLVNGDYIAGAGLGFQNSEVLLRSDRFGQHKIPAQSIAAFILAPQNTHLLDRVVNMAPGAEFINGDSLSGNLAFLNAVSAGINTGKRIIDMPRTRLTLLRLDSAFKPNQAPHHIRLVSGERISGTITTQTAEFIQLNHVLFGEIKLTIDMISCWWTATADIKPISHLALTTSQSGYLDAGIAPRADRTWRNEKLTQNNNIVEHGLNTRARSEVTFTLPQPATAVIVSVMLDSAYGQRGDAVVRIMGDNKSLAEVALADHKSHTITVPVQGVSKVTFVTDAGPDGTTTDDEVIWAWAVVVNVGP